MRTEVANCEGSRPLTFLKKNFEFDNHVSNIVSIKTDFDVNDAPFVIKNLTTST
eukprot:m.27758 g.27758  ORF g.27758 m.27758 type:complete len:54 (+) comp30310_c0_seq1:1361-1522(+)